MAKPPTASPRALAAALCCGALLAQPAAAQDDTDLFSAAGQSNLLLLIDNSTSMRVIAAHPDYDPSFSCTEVPAPQPWYPAAPVLVGNVPQATAIFQEACLGQPVAVYPDLRSTQPALYTHLYLIWLTKGASPQVLQDLRNYTNGTYATQCEEDWFGGRTTFARYIRTRLTIVKDTLAKVLCGQKNRVGLRVGLATFRRYGQIEANSTTPSTQGAHVLVHSTQGAYVLVPVDELAQATDAHFNRLRDAIKGIEATTETPLSEALFHLYPYFMSRDATQTLEVNGKKFPNYIFSTRPGNGPYLVNQHVPDGVADTQNVPPDPMQTGCPQSAILILTDGFPQGDAFQIPDSSFGNRVAFDVAAARQVEVAKVGTLRRPTYIAHLQQIEKQIRGWADLSALIPDVPNYAGENSICATAGPTGSCYNRSVTSTPRWDIMLDDIAKLMATADYRPDIAGDQTIKISTIAFAAGPQANVLLRKTANLGGGAAFVADQVDDIQRALEKIINTLTTDAQTFSSPLIPAVVRSTGASFFLASFKPSAEAFWKGFLQHFELKGTGEVGQLHWDAGAELAQRSPGARDLRVSVPLPTTATPPRNSLRNFVPFVTTGGGNGGIVANTVFRNPNQYQGFGNQYQGSEMPAPDTSNFDPMKQEHVFWAAIHTMRGCNYPTRFSANSSCSKRPSLLGDIFHSQPVLVGSPRGFSVEPSYKAFQRAQLERERRIYVGANDGFLHAFDAGAWDTTTRRYSPGTGAERFGFMPWPVRRAIPDFVRDISNKTAQHRFFVDASPAASDAWFYPSPTARNKQRDGREWRTVLIGGLRRGGNAYYALDVSAETSTGTPATGVKYLWEFPDERDPAPPPIGQTWARPVIVKVQVRHNNQPHERWVAVVTGGYAPDGDPNRWTSTYSATSEVGRGIYLIDVVTGQVLGEKRMVPTTDTVVSQTDPRRDMAYAIASAPAVFDIDGDDFADVLYVGDLGGNIWKWVIAYRERDDHYLHDAVNGAASRRTQLDTTFHLFFSARKNAAASLGVTQGTESYFHSFFFPPAGVLRSRRLWLTMATGERAHLRRAAGTADDANVPASLEDNNRFYTVVDPKPVDTLARPVSTGGTPAPKPPPPDEVTEADLLNVTAKRDCPTILPTQRGYYFLAENGEKFSTRILITRFRVIVGSVSPPGSAVSTIGGCPTQTQQGHLYGFKLRCGQGLGASMPEPGSREGRRTKAGAGTPNSPRRTIFLPDGSSKIYHTTSGNNQLKSSPGPTNAGGGLGQLYWLQTDNRAPLAPPPSP